MQGHIQTSMSYSHSYSSRVISSQRNYQDERLKSGSSSSDSSRGSDSSQNHREVIEMHLGRRSGEGSSSGEEEKKRKSKLEEKKNFSATALLF